MFENIPNVKLGLIAVSRDCFPRTLSEMRRANIAKACEGGVYECPVTVENENDMLKAVADVKAAECNAAGHQQLRAGRYVRGVHQGQIRLYA